MFGIIYKFTIQGGFILRDGKLPFYIGQHHSKINETDFIDMSYPNYIGSGTIWLEYINELKKKFHKSWRCFVLREVLYCSENITPKGLDVLETYFIKREKALYKYKQGGCNVLLGTANNFGGSNPMQDINIRRKVSKKLKGRFVGKKCYWYGKHLSEETKQILSEKAKERLRKNNPNKGRKLTDEQREHIRQGALRRDKSTFARGFKRTEEQKERVRQGVKRYYKEHKSVLLGKHLVNGHYV